jgi:hypothetical protein
MAEQNYTQQAANAFEKAINEQAARFETAFAEWSKLQSKGIAQATALIEGATRVAQEQVAFAEQLGGEWRKLVLSATRNAAELFAPKA